MSSKITGKRENRGNGSKELKVVRHFHLSLRVGPFLGLAFLKPVLSFFFTIEFRFSLFSHSYIFPFATSIFIPLRIYKQ